jgi:hypothetical protein
MAWEIGRFGRQYLEEWVGVAVFSEQYSVNSNQ